MKTQLGTAFRIAATVFENVTDRGGNAYMEHCVAVMTGLGVEADEDQKAIAILHDVLEDDASWTIERLRAEGINERCLAALKCLTHPKDELYDDYIKRCASNSDASLVKMSDLRHNSDLRRLKGVRPKDFERVVKYMRAHEYLKMVRNAHETVYS